MLQSKLFQLYSRKDDASFRRKQTRPIGNSVLFALVTGLLAVMLQMGPAEAAFLPQAKLKQPSSFLPTRYPVSTSAPKVLKEPNVEISCHTELTKPRKTNGIAEPYTRYKAITLSSLDELAEKHPELKPHLYDIHLAGLVFLSRRLLILSMS